VDEQETPPVVGPVYEVAMVVEEYPAGRGRSAAMLRRFRGMSQVDVGALDGEGVLVEGDGRAAAELAAMDLIQEIAKSRGVELVITKLRSRQVDVWGSRWVGDQPAEDGL
jgi:hypothetical protein